MIEKRKKSRWQKSCQKDYLNRRRERENWQKTALSMCVTIGMFRSMKVAKKQKTDESIMDKALIAEEKPLNLVTMREESGPNGCRVTGLGDLPESAIASILSLTAPRDVARLSCVNRTFRGASESDIVWQMMLPRSFANILALAADAPASTCPKKEVYNFLSNGIVLQNGTRGYWLDRATGAACRTMGSRELGVIGGDNYNYWKWCSKEGARFSEVVYLKVWWLEVSGRWQCNLPPGTYTFSWRLSLAERSHWDNIGPLMFSFEATGNEPVNSVCYLTRQGARTSRNGTLRGQQQPLGYRCDGDAWMELDVGEFAVESEDYPFEIDFHLKGKTNDLYSDGVAIRPSFTIRNRISLSELEVRKRTHIRHGPRRTSRMRPLLSNFRLH